ncbi:MAG: hypothetical protein HYU25_06235 [Candidatus Rokubacteria bacterium]|nr:hypothetical protein [Candidatus Rokubacteria bacterium]
MSRARVSASRYPVAGLAIASRVSAATGSISRGSVSGGSSVYTLKGKGFTSQSSVWPLVRTEWGECAVRS